METHILEPTGGRSRKRRRIPLWITVPGCMLLALLLLMWRVSAMLEAERHPSLPMIAEWTGLKFPDGTVLTGSYTSHGMGDRSLLAKIEMNRSDVDALIKSLPKSKMRQDFDCIGVRRHHPLLEWWDPGSVRKSRSVGIHRDDADGRSRDWRMLIDLDDSRTAVIYLEFLEG